MGDSRKSYYNNFEFTHTSHSPCLIILGHFTDTLLSHNLMASQLCLSPGNKISCLMSNVRESGTSHHHGTHNNAIEVPHSKSYVCSTDSLMEKLCSPLTSLLHTFGKLDMRIHCHGSSCTLVKVSLQKIFSCKISVYN